MRKNPEFQTTHRSVALNDARVNMQKTGCWSQNQQMGRRWAIGCVALEITQRCNLDCTLCYLSEHSEAVKDIPITEIFKRIDQIYEYYGPHTDIQVTGGDPTLRQHGELIAIIRYIRDKHMRSTLMTNGIKATRPLLSDLASAGLNDVAFHVDTTQEIKGYKNEIALNELRKKYIHRAKGLGLSIMFNTTVHEDNFHELPELVIFFRQQAKYIRTVSFQLQADTGRGIKGKRAPVITPETVWRQIEKGANIQINHNALTTGHPDCNRYGMCLVINSRLFDLFDDTETIGELHMATADIVADRHHPLNTVGQIIQRFYLKPYHAGKLLSWVSRKFLEVVQDLIKSRGKITTLSFFVHNFMDGCSLENDRIKACVFKAITRDGPVSMCLYNAKRDDYILKPIKVDDDNNFWQPLTGAINKDPHKSPVNVYAFPLKKLKGKLRHSVLRSKQLQVNTK